MLLLIVLELIEIFCFPLGRGIKQTQTINNSTKKREICAKNVIGVITTYQPSSPHIYIILLYAPIDCVRMNKSD